MVEKTAIPYLKVLEEIKEVDLGNKAFVTENIINFCFTRFRLETLDKERDLIISGKFNDAKQVSLLSYKHTNEQGKELDLKRQISNEEKLNVFSKLPDQLCELCRNVKFKNYKEAEYHHIDRYIDGGKTKKDNIMAICKECHKRLHGKAVIIVPNENEIEEENE